MVLHVKTVLNNFSMTMEMKAAKYKRFSDSVSCIRRRILYALIFLLETKFQDGS